MFPLKDNIPTDRFPVVTVALIIANVLIYFFLQDGGWEVVSNDTGDWPVSDYALVPCDITGECVAARGHIGDVASVFTSMFMHGSLLHLGGNMLFLWIFGNNVEDSMGHVKFVAFYLLGGVAALLGQTLIDPDAAVPTIGASGAVAAVLGGYLLLYPRARVLTLIFLFIFFTFIQIPAMFFLVIWFGQQLLFGFLDYANPTGGGGGVAYFAHIGGFLFGLAAIKLFATQAQEDYDARRRPPVY